TPLDRGDRAGLRVPDRPPAADVALAWVHAERYDLAAAQLHGEQAATAPGIRDDPVSVGSLALTRGRLHRARGDLAGAITVVDRAQTILTTSPTPAWLLGKLAASAAVWRVATGTPTAGPAFKAAIGGPHVPHISAHVA